MRRYCVRSEEMVNVAELRSTLEDYDIVSLEYIDFLARQNGGVAKMKSGGSLLFYSLSNESADLRPVWERARGTGSGELLPIGEVIGCGKLIVLKRNGHIFLGAKVCC